MTKDDIIRIGRDAAAVNGHTLKAEPSAELIETLEAFYHLAIAHERERLGTEYRKELDKLSARNYELRKENEAIRARSQS